ncbi:TPA: hypothetical protein EYP70_03535 [Candidatus Bathyarchaeota archaeon]|nr:hypothetical protein [Candidatus Bathyarchaeota archaeon]
MSSNLDLIQEIKKWKIKHDRWFERLSEGGKIPGHKLEQLDRSLLKGLTTLKPSESIPVNLMKEEILIKRSGIFNVKGSGEIIGVRDLKAEAGGKWKNVKCEDMDKFLTALAKTLVLWTMQITKGFYIDEISKLQSELQRCITTIETSKPYLMTSRRLRVRTVEKTIENIKVLQKELDSTLRKVQSLPDVPKISPQDRKILRLWMFYLFQKYVPKLKRPSAIYTMAKLLTYLKIERGTLKQVVERLDKDIDREFVRMDREVVPRIEI